MQGNRLVASLVISSFAWLAGCSGHGGTIVVSGGSGTAAVSLTMTDTPPTGVTLLSFQVLLTGAALNPGAVSLVSSPVTVELRRLEEETAFLTNTNVPAGTYSSLTLTFASPSLTFQNNTTQTIANCAPGAICTVTPRVTTATATVTFPSPGFTVVNNSPVGLLVDANLNGILTNSLSVDFSTGVSVSQLTPVQSGGVLVPIENVVGQVMSTDGTNRRFNLQTSLGTFVTQVDGNTAFLNFPANVCSPAGFACLKAGQIVAVDLSLQAGGTLLAKNLSFEDSDTSKAEVEGVIVSVNKGAQHFSMVVLGQTPSVTGLSVGTVVTVNTSGTITFDVDNLGPDTSAFSFQGLNDLQVGQEVQVRRLSTSSGTTINPDRVRLESSRFTATISSVNAPAFNVSSLPSLFASASPSITQIQAQTSAFTEFAGNATNFSQLTINDIVSLRGQLFANAGSPVLVATKVIKR
ncbi:MAG TPA: DUF5666 domain-containing protein [Candidatus Acidoferrales bacterium]|jgi:predicted component of type VI protein secretion system|nr:DUF5666 domain-containing protein [Candidatus Acidoferrales bacterium]